MMLMLLVVLAAAGCRHVGGKCDCGPVPGEATMYAPYGSSSTPMMSSTPSIKAESIGAPKQLPKS